MAIKAITISGYTQGNLAISSTAATTVPADIPELADYALWTDVDCYIKIGPPETTTVTVANGFILYAGGMPPPITISKGSCIQAITSSASGTLRYHKIGVLR